MKHDYTHRRSSCRSITRKDYTEKLIEFYFLVLRRHNLPTTTRSLLSSSLKVNDLSIHRSITPYRSLPTYKSTPPVFYTSPHNIVAENGEAVRFQVTVGGFPSPNVTWLKDGRPVTNGPRFRTIEKFNTKILEIAHLSPQDTGNYTIAIQNDGGRAYASARLDMIALKERTPYQFRLKY